MYYDILKASKVKAEVFPDYWTLLWGRKMSASMIKTITGVLPLTFTAKGGNVSDWVIEGKDENGAEQLFDGATIQKGIIYNGVPSYSQDTVSASFENGIITFTTQNSGYRGVYFDFIEIDDTYTVSVKNVVGNGTAYLLIDYYDENKSYISRQTGTVPSSYPHQKSYTPPASTKYVRVSVQNNEIGTMSVEQLMLVSGSTAPDHYIPYQQGVGERTENLFDVNEATPVTSYRFMAYTFICEPNTQYTMIQNEKMMEIDIYTDSTKSELLFRAYNTNSYTFNSGNHESVFFRVDGLAAQSDYREAEIMLIKGSTVPDHYIPHGYQIPITVSQQGQTDKTVDIYIGDSPLTEGETVSKSSTGVDIELFEGENTVSTTLYNKPTMGIKYK